MFPSHRTVFHATSTYAVQAASQISPCLQSRRSWRWCRCACKRVVGASLRPAPTISAHARGARTTTGSASPRASLGQFSPASITRLCPSHEHAGCVLGPSQAMAFLLSLEGDLASRFAPGAEILSALGQPVLVHGARPARGQVHSSGPWDDPSRQWLRCQ